MSRFSRLLLLAALSFACASAAWTCTPIVPGCVCQTTSTFSCDDVENIRQDFRHKFASLLGTTTTPQQIRANPLQTTLALGRFKGGIVRLAFHDAAEFNATRPNSFLDGSPRFRADGCVDLSNGGNAGLDRTIDALQPMWLPYCTKISRADFWYLAAKITIEESTPYTKIGNPFLPVDPNNNGPTIPAGVHNVTNFTIPFFIGRVDRTDCALAVGQPESLPAAEGGALEIKRSLMDNIGLDPFHTAALMGAHTLGGAGASGYHGTWTTRPDLFNVDYYHQLADVPWRRVSMPNPTAGGAALQQWNRTNNNNNNNQPPPSTFMLNTDIAMIYNVAGNLLPQLENSLPQTCPALQGPPPNGGRAQPNAATQKPQPPAPQPPQGTGKPGPAAPQPPQGIGKPGPAAPQPPQGNGKPGPAAPQPPQGTGKPQAPQPPAQPQGNGGCPFTRLAYSQLNFEAAITAFTHGTPQTGDMPGAQIWLDAFSRAFTYLAGVGYTSGDLKCLPCAVFSCVGCSTAALCGTTNAYAPHGAPRMTSMTMTPDMVQSGSNSNGPLGQLAAASGKNTGMSQAHSATIAGAVVGAAVGMVLLSVGGVAWIRRIRRTSRTCPEAAQQQQEEGPVMHKELSAKNVSDIVLTEKEGEIQLPASNVA